MALAGSERNTRACLQKPDMVWFNATAISRLLWQSHVGRSLRAKAIIFNTHYSGA